MRLLQRIRMWWGYRGRRWIFAKLEKKKLTRYSDLMTFTPVRFSDFERYYPGRREITSNMASKVANVVTWNHLTSLAEVGYFRRSELYNLCVDKWLEGDHE